MRDESTSDAELFSLLENMQRQLFLLEKKVDLLISRSQEKPSGNRQFRDRSFGRERGRRNEESKQRSAAQGHFYERRPATGGRGANPRKKRSGFPRKDWE